MHGITEGNAWEGLGIGSGNRQEKPQTIMQVSHP